MCSNNNACDKQHGKGVQSWCGRHLDDKDREKSKMESGVAPGAPVKTASLLPVALSDSKKYLTELYKISQYLKDVSLRSPSPARKVCQVTIEPGLSSGRQDVSQSSPRLI